MLKNINKKIFHKLYRYYWNKLLKTLWLPAVVYLLFAIVAIWGISIGSSDSSLWLKVKNVSWQEILVFFSVVSLSQLFLLRLVNGWPVSEIIGIKSGWFSFQKKIDKTDDIRVITYTPGVTRENIMIAKIAAFATYFFATNFLFWTLPIFFGLLFNGFSAGITLTFLLLNGLVFAIINYLFLVPYLFWLYENYSLIGDFGVLLVLWITLQVVSRFYLKIPENYQFLLPLGWASVSVLAGIAFFYLYWKSFLQKDLA